MVVTGPRGKRQKCRAGQCHPVVPQAFFDWQAQSGPHLITNFMRSS